jgi:RNA polymerase sigma-70 factor (ECF subfamily)
MTRSVEDSRIVEVETFDAFFRREYRPVLGLALVLTRDRWAAEDLTQEAFTEAQRRWPHVGALDRPGAWVRRVVANKSVSRWRRLGAEARALRRMPTVENPAPDPEFAAETTEVLDALRLLPKRQAQVLALTYVEGLTATEVGEVLGFSTATAKTHLKRGRAAVAHRLGVEVER